MKSIRVKLVAAGYRETSSLREPLERDPSMEVLAPSQTASSAVGAGTTSAQRADVVVLDVDLPCAGASAVCRRLVAAHDDAKVVVVADTVEPALLGASLRCGARGYLLRDVDYSVLRSRLADAAAGHLALDPRAARFLADYVRQHEPLPTLLNSQEVRLLGLLARGLSNAEIGSALDIGGAAVEEALDAIYEKLAVGSRIEAAVEAKGRGLI